MKKLATFVTLALVISCALAACGREKHRITVDIEGWGDDRIIVQHYTFDGQWGVDTLVAQAGTLRFDPSPDEPMEIVLFRERDKVDYFIPVSQSIVLVVFPGERLVVRGTAADGAVRYGVTGSSLMEDLAALREQTLDRTILKDRNELESIELSRRGSSQEQQNSFDLRRSELHAEIMAAQSAFIRSHPDREAAAFLSLSQPLDSLAGFYSLFSREVREGRLHELLDQRMEALEEIDADQRYIDKLVGTRAPDFTLRDLQGNLFTLSQFDTDKYMVLDFWGSWCGPCIGGMPAMREYYARHGGRLEIIGIACRDREADWRKAVAQHQLPWINLLNDESSPERDVSALYAVRGYPTKIIMDPDREILAVYLGEDPAFYTKLDELLR